MEEVALGNGARFLSLKARPSVHGGGVVAVGVWGVLRVTASSCTAPACSRVNPAFSHQEQLVLVELSGIIDSDFLSKCENKCKILVSILELGSGCRFS